MASFTLERPDVFPSGTVKVWPAANARLNSPLGLGGIPQPGGSSTAEATVTSGKLTWTGLTAGTKYVAWAEVSSVGTQVEFEVPKETPSTEEKERALKAELAIEDPPLFGGLEQIGAPGRPARSNWQGSVALTDGAAVATEVLAGVPISVQVGDVFTKLGIFVGATAGATMTHSWGALYKGAETEALSTLIAQTTDRTNAAIAEKAFFVWTFATAVEITEAMAPFKYIYAGYAVAAATVPTSASFAEIMPAGIRYRWNPASQKSPLFETFTATGGAATAAAKLESVAHRATCPVIVLY